MRTMRAFHLTTLFALAALSLAATQARAVLTVTSEVRPHSDPGINIAQPVSPFSTIPNLSNTDYAEASSGHGVTFMSVGAAAHGASGPTTKVQDGLWPWDGDADAPSQLLFSDDGNWALQINLNGLVNVREVNTYSRHVSDRTDQRYNLYGTTLETPPTTNGSPVGWTLIATVDTSLTGPPTGTGTSFNGIAGVSIADSTGASIGNYSYLLLDPTQSNTFWGEIDIKGSYAGPATPVPADITVPGDPIVAVVGMDDGDNVGGGATSPGAEGVANAIDNTNAKYLNFYDLGSGFTVTPAFGPSILTGLLFTTAGDAEARDPASYILEGSNNGVDFDVIASGLLMLPSGRNTVAPLVDLPIYRDAYTSYRLTFPTLKNAGGTDSMQIGEVGLLGLTPERYALLHPTPEPVSMALLGLGAMALGVRRRRRC